MLSTPKGTHDLLPEDLSTWQFMEAMARETFARSNFQEIRTPILEYTELFARGVGDSTDIVNKEMYSFEKGDRQLTLRPENTAGVVRAYIQHGMDRWPKPVKLFYMGPQFRYERPQAGRQRQFHQVGAELFGIDTPQSDLTVIALAYDFLALLGLNNLSLEINNVGCFVCREDFKIKFKALVKPYLSELCEDCNKRYETNPLRMLDCKNPTCKAVYQRSDIQAFLNEDQTCSECQTHFQTLLDLLEKSEISAHRNKMLVRGLDYYTRTVFEITSNHLGAQNAVCGGGRYNGLVKTLGGPDTPAVGWAMGMERLISLIQKKDTLSLDYYVASDDLLSAQVLARKLRQQGYSVDLDLSGKALGKQLAQADKLGVRQVAILGESERLNGTVTLKDMTQKTQTTVPQESLFR